MIAVFSIFLYLLNFISEKSVVMSFLHKTITRHHIVLSALNSRRVCVYASIILSITSPMLSVSNADDVVLVSLPSEIASYQEDTESATLRQQKVTPMQKLKAALNVIQTKKQTNVENARERVLTLKAYLDEAERDLFAKNWNTVQVYLTTFGDQEDAFSCLIDELFPSSDELDAAARGAMTFEARSMFLALDDLRDAAKDHKFNAAQRAYAMLLISYDRFLKAGDLYATYDPITSNEIFFTTTPSDALPFDRKSKIQARDRVVLVEGPDMGKSGTLVFIDGGDGVVKLDKDGKSYQEVKFVDLQMLAKLSPDSE